MANETVDEPVLSKDDIFDSLKDDTTEDLDQDKTEEIVIPDEDEDKDEEVEEKEEEDEVVEDEDEELEDVLAPLSRKAVLKKYPEIFKDFPQLEKGYYGNQKYRELFPTLGDAEEAIQKIETFETIETELNSGSSEGLLKALKENNPQSFGEMIDNYLPNLAKVDPDAYYHVIGNTIKNAIVAMAKEAQTSKNDDLLTAARIVNQFTFGQSEFAPPAKFSKEIPKEVNELETERAKFATERLETHKSEVTTKVNSTISKTIADNIDPKQSMTDYVKRTATREAQDMVSKTLSNDKEFSRYLDKMWDRAKKDNFSADSIAKIRSAYVSKAKTVLPQVIRKVRLEALQGSGRGKQEVVEKDRKGRLPVGGPSTPRNSNKGGSSVPKGMRSIDFLNQD